MWGYLRREKFTIFCVLFWEVLSGVYLFFIAQFAPVCDCNRGDMLPPLQVDGFLKCIYIAQLVFVSMKLATVLDDNYTELPEDNGYVRCRGVDLVDCVICAENNIEMIYPKCGHYCICKRCSGIQGTKCPLCCKESVPIKVFQ